MVAYVTNKGDCPLFLVVIEAVKTEYILLRLLRATVRRYDWLRLTKKLSRFGCCLEIWLFEGGRK